MSVHTGITVVREVNEARLPDAVSRVRSMPKPKNEISPHSKTHHESHSNAATEAKSRRRATK